MSQHIGPRTVSGTGGSIKRVGNYRIHTFPSEIVTDGLILNLDPGDPDSYPSQGLIWNDLSGMGNNGTLTTNNTPTYQTVNGGIFSFDGNNDFLTTSFPADAIAKGDIASQYTLEAWIYVETSSGTNLDADGIMGHTGNYGVGMQVGASGGSPRINYGARGANNFYGPTFSYQEWRHIVLTRDGISGPIAYENAAFAASTADQEDLDIVPDQTISGFNIGYCGPRVSGYFHGKMGPIRVYNRALSAAEVAQNYDALKVRYTTYTNTFTPICAGPDGKVEVLCVAGGGGGGGGDVGSGGGAGGLIYNSAFDVNSNTAISLSVGKGGRGSAVSNSQASDGDNTTFGSLTAIGGGGGNGWAYTNGNNAGRTGGSGGGGRPGGAGTTGQGFAGGTDNSLGTPNYPQGGGGGAGGHGQDAYQISGDGTEVPGDGGPGLQYSISGEPKYYAGGGGGGIESGQNNGRPTSRGGSGVGGNGGRGAPSQTATNGVPNTGSGGGGDDSGTGVGGGNGSNGTVIVRYPATDYNVELLIVGGGGGGGSASGSNNAGPRGGGGAGGLIYHSKYACRSGENYLVVVGQGGASGQSQGSENDGVSGGNSRMDKLIAFGGGFGAGYTNSLNNRVGGNGGSGGGSAYTTTHSTGVPGQGNAGGAMTSSFGGAGGGGGAGQPGFDPPAGDAAADGGDGLAYSITGTSTYYAGGGASGRYPHNGSIDGIGGLGGGGNGTTGSTGTGAAGNGTDGLGGGGGGGGASTASSGRGGSGVVIIAYKGPQRGIGGTIDTTSRPGYTLHKFTEVGSHIFIP